MRILVVTHPYPPMPSVGGNRWLAMSKYLRRMGHEVSILTTSAFGSLPDDAENDVFRATDLIAAPWLRSALRRPALPQGGEAAGIDKPPHWVITSVVVPDHYAVTWVPYAIRAARRIIRERSIECVITTSAYESTHLVGLGLGRNRPAWIADFRDGWTYEPWKPPFPTGLQRRIDRRLEAAVVRGAERVVVVERSVGEDFERRLGVTATYVPNGWDAELEQDAGSAAPPYEPEPDTFTLVHTGRMIGGWGRHPGPLMRALRDLAEEEPEVGGRLRLVLAGHLDEQELALVREFEPTGLVRHLGHLTRAQAMALQRSADALVLLTSPSLTWELPGKVFEYIGAGRPVLALATDNDAARLVQETGIGWTVAPDDEQAIKRALRRFAAGELEAAYAPTSLERYIYPAPAEAIASEAAEAAAKRGR